MTLYFGTEGVLNLYAVKKTIFSVIVVNLKKIAFIMSLLKGRFTLSKKMFYRLVGKS